MKQLQGKVVLITGGSRGLGRAMGVEFSRCGAKVYLTYRWGGSSEEDVLEAFKKHRLPSPRILESDVSSSEEIESLMRTIKNEAGRCDVIISNVSFAKVVPDLSDFKRDAFQLSLTYSTWPVIELTKKCFEVFSKYPGYILGVSSQGTEVCLPGYDFVGACKSALETLCCYLALRLKAHGTRVNALRPSYFDSESLRDTFSEEVIAKLEKKASGILLDPHEIAKVAVALCSGYMDAVTGQVINIDEGWSHVSSLALLTGEGIPPPFPRE